MRQISILSLVLFLFVSVAATQETQLTAQQIIDQMSAKYASCKSYIDKGEVNTLFIQENGNRTVIKPFTTAFVRPSNFRFEYKDRRGENEWDSYIIWKEKDSVKSWWTIKPKVETPQGLSFALGTAAGVSSRSSLNIPALLMSDVGINNRFKQLSELKLIGEEKVDGSTAYKLEGVDLRKNKVTFWIDKKKFLILKIFEKQKFDKFETETTTTFKPQIDVKIAEDKLAFNIPAKTE
jgi:outer membrane lipoprotein-sorting protein